MNTSTSIARLESDKTGVLNQLASLAMKPLNEERKTAAERLETRLAEIDDELGMLRRIAAGLGDKRMAQLENTVSTVAATVKASNNGIVTTTTEVREAASAETRAKVDGALRVHFAGLKMDAEQRAVLDGQTNGGADLVAQKFNEAIRRAAAYVSPVVNLVHSEEASAQFKVAKSDDTGRYHLYAEAGSASVVGSMSYDPTLSSTASGNLDSLVSGQQISYNALDDIKDVDSFIQTNFGESIARSVSLAILKGVDNTNAALPNSPTGGLMAAAPVAGTTAALGTLAYSDIVTGLFSQLNMAYFNKGTLLVAPSTYSYLLAQVDSTGRPLYQVINGVLTIAGRPVFAANELDAVTVSGGNVALFGDFEKAYTYGQGSTQTYTKRETFAQKLAAEVISVHRMSGFAGISAAVKLLKNHA